MSQDYHVQSLVKKHFGYISFASQTGRIEYTEPITVLQFVTDYCFAVSKLRLVREKDRWMIFELVVDLGIPFSIIFL